MLHKQPFKYIFAKKLFTLLIMLSLIGSVAPTVALLARTPEMNPDVDAVVTCDNLRTLAVNDALEQSAAWRSAQAEWIKFTVQANARYSLQVNDSTALRLALYDRCDANAPAVALRDGQLEFTATRDGDYYLLLRHDGVSSASVSGYQVALSPAAPHRPSFAPTADVPQAVQRRAQEFLEEIRGSEMAPEWQDARVNPQARILYRPDMQEPAFYEFTVEKPVGGTAYEPAGFIQLAAGEHDYLVTHWDASGMSPTQELAELAPLGVQLTEFYKLDVLSYASEYEEFTPLGINTVATDTINLGDMPGRIEGLDAIPEEAAELMGDSVDSDGNTEHEGPTELPLVEREDWDSWAALKAGYEEEYGPLLKSLKQSASEEWELENNISQYGESLLKGDVRTVYGLPAQTLSSIQVTGDGAEAQYLQQEQLSDQGTPTGVRLTVLDEPADVDTRLTFEVALQYTGGATETIKYAIINSAWLNEVYLPLISNGANSSRASVKAVSPAETSGSWGSWHYYYADGSGTSESVYYFKYGQIPAYSSPNSSSCVSGCGATAWAMLFGWVDRRAAEGHWRWNDHWGLYRVNGGLGSNAVAPLVQYTGVKNMTWEIRNDINTFCWFGSGATGPWDMYRASNYVQPRVAADWSIATRYDPTGLCWFGACNGNRDLAKNQIIYRDAPAVIGTGWLTHYPLAYGYRWRSKRSCFLTSCWTNYQREFKVNQGWYGSGNGWVNANVWFAGTYRNW